MTGMGGSAADRGLVRSFRCADLRDAVRRSLRNGCSARLDGRGHVVVEAPHGGRSVRLSVTAFSGPGTRRTLEQLVRSGAIRRDRRTERLERRRQRREAGK